MDNGVLGWGRLTCSLAPKSRETLAKLQRRLKDVLGLIFESVREFVSEEYGEDTWDKLLDDAGLEGIYTRLGNYPYRQLVSIVGAAAKTLDKSPPEAWRLAGRAAFVKLRNHSPAQIDSFENSQQLFHHLEDTIHQRVTILHPESSPPKFQISEEGNDILLIYSSHRGLCHLAEGLASGAVKYFRQTAKVEQTHCGLDSGSSCHIRISYQTI